VPSFAGQLRLTNLFTNLSPNEWTLVSILIYYKQGDFIVSNTLANGHRGKEEVCDWCINGLNCCQQRTLVPIIKGLKNHQAGANETKHCYDELKEIQVERVIILTVFY
jgi:hypothetical protein